MTKKICIVGSPSCRKSTVSVTLESLLKQKGFNADVAEEYARTYIQRYGVPFSPFQQFLIFEKQIRRENDIISTGADFMITDTAPWLGAIYTQILIENCLFKEALVLSEIDKISAGQKANLIESVDKCYKHAQDEIFKKCIESIKTYDYIFFAPVQQKAVVDGVRTQSEDDRLQIQEGIRGILNFMGLSGVKYYTIEGTVEEKADKILSIIL